MQDAVQQRYKFIGVCTSIQFISTFQVSNINFQGVLSSNQMALHSSRQPMKVLSPIKYFPWSVKNLMNTTFVLLIMPEISSGIHGQILHGTFEVKNQKLFWPPWDSFSGTSLHHWTCAFSSKIGPLGSQKLPFLRKCATNFAIFENKKEEESEEKQRLLPSKNATDIYHNGSS